MMIRSTVSLATLLLAGIFVSAERTAIADNTITCTGGEYDSTNDELQWEGAETHDSWYYDYPIWRGIVVKGAYMPVTEQGTNPVQRVGVSGSWSATMPNPAQTVQGYPVLGWYGWGEIGYFDFYGYWHVIVGSTNMVWMPNE